MKETEHEEAESEEVENANDKNLSSDLSSDFSSELVIDEDFQSSDEKLPNSNSDDGNNETESNNETDSTSDNQSNVTYKLFTIGPRESSDCSKLMKEEMKEFHMLVRTKTDGVEVK